jgi:hypothetical protein
MHRPTSPAWLPSDGIDGAFHARAAAGGAIDLMTNAMAAAAARKPARNGSGVQPDEPPA